MVVLSSVDYHVEVCGLLSLTELSLVSHEVPALSNVGCFYMVMTCSQCICNCSLGIVPPPRSYCLIKLFVHVGVVLHKTVQEKLCKWS